VVLGSIYFFSLLALVTKLITDLMYVWVDPRVKFGASR
jgi:microcin C transport system permease protein